MGINTSDSIYKTQEEPQPVPESMVSTKKPRLVKKALPEAKPDPKPADVIAAKARWPHDNSDELQGTYGKVAVYDYNDEGRLNPNWESSYLQLLDLPYPMRGSWEGNPMVRSIACNRVVYQSLVKILYGIYDLYGRNMAKIQEAGMDLYGGCYCFRPRKSGHTLSVHSWGAAIDLNPENNGFDKKWVANSGMMPKEVVEIFMNEGWVWGGTFSRPDPMHFQAALE